MEPDGQPVAHRCHELLLRVAGAVPDEVACRARQKVADGAVAAALAEVRTALLAAEWPVARDAVELLADLVGGADGLTAVTVVDQPPARFSFAGTPGGADESTVDDVDGVAAAAAAAVPASGVWRAWRHPLTGGGAEQARRVYVVETPAGTDLPAAAAAIQQALAAAGQAAPQVEVFATGDTLCSYQRQAAAGGALIWAAAEEVRIEIARVFDTVDPVYGPAFHEDHPRLDDAEERAGVVRYLRAGAPLLLTVGLMSDVVEPERGQVVPMSFRTDGRWIWTDTVTYYLQEHLLAPDPDLMAHIRSTGRAEPSVDGVGLHRALEALKRPAPAGPRWSGPF